MQKWEVWLKILVVLVKANLLTNQKAFQIDGDKELYQKSNASSKK